MVERCVWKAVQYIKNDMIIGLGDGKTIQYLIEMIDEKNINVKIVTLSKQTQELCNKHHLCVIPLESVCHIDIIFDSCYEVDIQLNALKFGNKIYKEEKRMASMAKEYILLVEEKNVYENLPFHHNVILEVIPEKKYEVEKQIQLLKGHFIKEQRKSKDIYIMNSQGCLIIEVSFDSVDNVKELNHQLNQIPGIVGTSLFVDTITSIISLDDTHVRIIS